MSQPTDQTPDDELLALFRAELEPALPVLTALLRGEPSSIVPSVIASTRLPSNSTVPDGRIGETVLPARPLRSASSDAATAAPAGSSSAVSSDIRRHAEIATYPTAGSPIDSPMTATAPSTSVPL